jgi:integrase
LHKALDQALKWGLVVRNVSDLVESPKPKRKQFKTWTADEVKRFLSAVKGHTYYPIYVLAAYTGLRQGEVLAIHAEDVDLDAGVIHVRHQLTYIRGEGIKITEPKTESSRRPVTLPDSALQVLQEHLKACESKGLIFTTRSGRPISARNVVRHFKSVIEREGLPEIRFHDLRHTHATLLLAAGVHPKVVQERLGHSSIALTLDTYSHVIPSLQTEAADQFEELLA